MSASAIPCRLTLLFWALLHLSGCTQQAPAPLSAQPANPDHTDAAPHKDEERQHEGLPTRVRLSQEVLAAAKVRTAAVQSKALPMTVELTGEVAADPDRSAHIAARVSGRLAEVRMKEGGQVQAGALLAVLSSSELSRIRAAHVSAQARAASAQKNAERLGSLAKTGLAAAQEVADAIATARALQAEALAAERSLQSFGLSEAERALPGARLELRAPFAGFTLSRNAIVGQTVTAEHILCDVVNFDRAYFIGRLFERNLAQVRVKQPAEVRLNAYPGVVFVGQVESIGKQLDPSARTVVTRIAIPNQDDLLKIGLFGLARVSITEEKSEARGPVVPLSAVTRLAERDVVFVREPDDDFEVHPVTLGHSAAGEVQILSGLRVGEQVVIDGVFTLKSAVLKSTLTEEE